MSFDGKGVNTPPCEIYLAHVLPTLSYGEGIKG